ncbi:Transposon Ty3-I Gag-Pol poly [Paramuricea clavata]|uniref:Transposon Ty3-I Gag-Pol poly n=1 Tax=Paramuricea clavata TaxID=317549 RepID=A0A7D9HX48_PARCT|nr:Transposon Ty3-I Gag-Pol poly [Paramuricea clavata]
MATEEDESLWQLKKTVLSGWLDTKRETQVKIREYWHCREKISEIDGILLKNEKIIIPSSFRPEMLEKIRAGHMDTGSRREVKSDNGPQYTSQEFGKFSQEWNFQRTTTSPYHPQANGLAERSVQTVKNLLNKANRDGKDPYVSILEYRNTPIDQIVIDEDLASSKLISKKTFQKRYYDRGSKELPTISQGEQVRIKQGKLWNPAVVTSQGHTPRSYIVQSPDGSTYRRNRKHILKTKVGNSQLFRKEDCDDPISQSNEEDAVGTEPASDGDNAVSTEETSEEQ